MKKKPALLFLLLLLLTLCACNQTKEDSNVITTKYYTITLPDEWRNQYIYDIIDQENGTYTLNLYEKTSYEEMGAGKLCSLMLFSSKDKTYKDFPDYKLLAALDTPAGSYHVIALFPTDVQFHKTTLEAYNALFEQIMDVVYSIHPVDGIEMAMP